MAKAAGNRTSPLLWPPRQRPTLQRRNVCGHFADEQQPYWDRKLANAYDLMSYADAKRCLQQIQRELQQVNPSAARSLEEGLEETLTLHRLGVPAELRTTLRTTNPIESAFQSASSLSKCQALAPGRSARAVGWFGLDLRRTEVSAYRWL